MLILGGTRACARGSAPARLVMVILGALLITGCSDKPQREPEPAPTVRGLGSRKATTQRADPTAEGAAHCFSLPLYEPLDDAWAVTSESALDPVMTELWRQNGMRVRLLDPARYEEFQKALPRAFGAEAQRLIAGGEPIAVRVSAPTDRRLRVTLVTGDDGPRVESLSRGEPQFFVNLQDTQDGRVVAEVTPHLYQPRVTVQPRSPLESRFDGRKFSELTLRTVLTRGRLLVIGLEETPQRPRATQPATQPAPERRDETRLSDLFLTAQRMRRPTQVLLVIGLPASKDDAAKD
jgi:hypothetical protein